MKSRYRFIAPAALAWVLVGSTADLTPRAASAGETPRPRSKLSIGRLVGHQTETQSSEQAGKPAVRNGITLERLMDRWKGRREATQAPAQMPQQAHTPAQMPQQAHQPNQAVEPPLETPQPVAEPGNFPVFRAGPPPQGPVPATAPQPAPAVAARPIDVPRPIPVPRQANGTQPQSSVAAQPIPAAQPTPVAQPAPAAPSEASTSVMTRFETPVASRPPVASKPAVAESRQRSTSSYLDNEVRYGVILRGASRGQSLDPTAEILGEVKSGETDRIPATAEPQVFNSLRPAAPIRSIESDEPGPRPEMPPLKIENTARFRTIAPTSSAEIIAQPAPLPPVAPGATSAALQQALRRYGKPHFGSPTPAQEFQGAPTESPLQPIPEPQPLPPQPQMEAQTMLEPPVAADEDSQRSVLLGGSKPLGIDRPGQPQGSGSGMKMSVSRSENGKGSVARIDKTNRTILVVFSGSPLPNIGTKLQVSQKVLFHRHALGQFQVVGAQGNGVVARPIGHFDLDLIANGDEVVVAN